MPRSAAAVRDLGPGTLYWAPLGTALPVTPTTALTAFAAAWIDLGYTDNGHTFSRAVETEDTQVAETLEAIRTQVTGITETVSFEMAQTTAANLKVALNGGTTTVEGSFTKVEPPSASTMVRCMLGWDAVDGSERLIWRQLFNTGGIEISRPRTGKSLIPVEFAVETPSTGARWSHWFITATQA